MHNNYPLSFSKIKLKMLKYIYITKFIISIFKYLNPMEAEGLIGKCFCKKFLRTILDIFRNKIIFEN